MAIETYTYGEGWTMTFTLLDGSDNPVDADALKVVWRPFNGSDSAFAYVMGSDAELTQSGSGVYIFEDAAVPVNVYDVEWQATGTNKERKRTTVRIKSDLP